MQVATKTLKQVDKKDDSVVVYLLNITNQQINYDTLICGITMSDWVKKAISTIPYIEINYDNSNLIDFLKPRLVNSKYSIILFSNTPLITAPSILKIIEYVIVKNINACKFNGGFAFKNEYLKNTKEVMFDAFLPLDDEEFMVVNNKQMLLKSNKILQKRIIQNHINNGVEIFGACDIDAQVEIDKGCMIFKGNTIKGNTIIGENTILKENNIIEDCIIGSDVCISCSNLKNSKIENNVFILPYCYINNATIRKNCYISSNISVENRIVRAGTKLPKENK